LGTSPSSSSSSPRSAPSCSRSSSLRMARERKPDSPRVPTRARTALTSSGGDAEGELGGTLEHGQSYDRGSITTRARCAMYERHSEPSDGGVGRRRWRRS
jgi:hypothetical protein